MRYVAAKSAEEASNFLLQETGVSRVLAGGTDVLVQMKSGMIEPDLIVDIKKIPGIRNITELDDFFRIGAAVSGSEVKDHENINKMLKSPFSSRKPQDFRVLLFYPNLHMSALMPQVIGIFTALFKLYLQLYDILNIKIIWRDVRGSIVVISS